MIKGSIGRKKGNVGKILSVTVLWEDPQCKQFILINTQETRFDVNETLCPQQMLVHKGGQIENWSGDCRDIIPTKLQCQTIQRAIQSPNLQREITRKNNFFLNFHQLSCSSSSIS